MRKGRIKFVNLKSKFGFIKDTDTGEEFYFKTAELKTSDTDDYLTTVFNFELKDSKKGQEAIHIHPENNTR